MSASITVQCPTCKVSGIYEAPLTVGGAELEEWRPLPCFFTLACPGHIWPELPN